MKRIITMFDKECLSALIRRVQGQLGGPTPDLLLLQEVLDSAEITEKAPPDTITLDSVAVLRSAITGRQHLCSPVLPALADVGRFKLSVLAPLGMAMLGRRVGETFEVKTQVVTRVFSVEQVLSQLDVDESSSGMSKAEQGKWEAANNTRRDQLM